MAQLHVRRLGYACGAEVTGIDLARKPDEATAAEIKQIWLDNHVLCFPGQRISKDAFVAFAGCFGTIDRLNPETRDLENAYIGLVTNQPIGTKPWDGRKQGEHWHSDRSFSTAPSPGTFVLGKELPPVGGDTMFSNQYLAYETLSPALQRILGELSAVHDDAVRDNPTGKHPPVVHSVIRVHPATKRKGLYVGANVRRFIGMTEEESRPLIAFLQEHAVRYEFVYRHRWRVDDLVMWDNNCLMHYAVADYDQSSERRHLWRCTLQGRESGITYDPANPERVPELVAAG